MRQHFHAARRGSQSAYKARPQRPIATSASGLSWCARRFKHATLKAVFSGERPATLNAASGVRFTRDVRRDSTRRRKPPASWSPAKRQTASLRAWLFPTAEWESRGR